MFNSKVIEKVKKNIVGKYIYDVNKIKNKDGIIIDQRLGTYIGVINDVDLNGNCYITNWLGDKEILNLIELNKEKINGNYILKNKMI